MNSYGERGCPAYIIGEIRAGFAKLVANDIQIDEETIGLEIHSNGSRLLRVFLLI